MGSEMCIRDSPRLVFTSVSKWGLRYRLEWYSTRHHIIGNPLPHPHISNLTNNGCSRYQPWLPVRDQPATCALPCIICLSITRRVLVSLLHADSTSTRLAFSLSRTYSLTEHAFHIMSRFNPAPHTPDVLRSIVHTKINQQPLNHRRPYAQRSLAHD